MHARSGRPSNTFGLLIGVAACLLGLFAILVVVYSPSAEDEPGTPAVDENAGVAESPLAELVDPPTPPLATANSAEIDDDGRTLWTSPTEGGALDLRLVPSGSQVVLATRPAALLANVEGAKVWEILLPNGSAEADRLQAELGVEWEQLDQWLVAVYPSASDTPEFAHVLRFRQEPQLAALLAAWGQPERMQHAGHEFFLGARWAYLVSDELPPSVLIAAEQTVRQAIDQRGQPTLRKELESLAEHADNTRDINLLFAPGYPLGDGHALLAGELAGLQGPLTLALDESLRGVLLSAHFSEQLFLEVRALATADKQPRDVAARLRNQLELARQQAERYAQARSTQEYGGALVRRWPDMLSTLYAYTRFDVEGREAVLRAYLPLHAAHNLVLAARVLLDDMQTAPAVKSVAGGAPEATASLLDRPVTLRFERDTLERCLEMLSAAIDVPISISGGDLQLEGITRNQSFGLDERQQPAGEVLRRVLRLASPEGKLIYVLKTGDDGTPRIEITTRAGATRRGESIPPEFMQKSAGETR